MNSKKEHLYSGKAKSIFSTEDPKKVIMNFRDDLTAFNGEKKAVSENKGIYNNHLNAHLMKKLSKKGIKVGFIKLLNNRECLVHRLEMIKLEFVVRNIAAGTLVKRSGISKGSVISPPIQEIFLKDDSLGDPFINIHYVRAMKIAEPDIVAECERKALEINGILQDIFAKIGIDLVDFKLEFGLLDGEIYLGDEVTPDACRLWDKNSKRVFDKDLFRFDLGSVQEGYERLCSMLGIEVSIETDAAASI